MTQQAFDHIAHRYDADFSESYIGQLQRSRVHHLLQDVLSNHRISRVLELNCGTGLDAFWLAEHGCEVLATDNAVKMIDLCKQKALLQKTGGKAAFRQLAIQELPQLSEDQSYDLIFSNFGGLNCLAPEELLKLAQQCNRLLKPGGHFIAVVMPGFCWWESLYFLAKGKWKAAWRRSSKGPVRAKIAEAIFVDTWYHSPAALMSSFQDDFKMQRISAVGFFIPPSYLDTLFAKRKNWLAQFSWLEDKLPDTSLWAGGADHFFIHLYKHG